ncbi:MAG: class I SAM-dependent methyltransferase [Deltaproteobacteria bacterium]|nr:class I SAM-dependent methyltransferase [Deltaproteobacteria bacterium]
MNKSQEEFYRSWSDKSADRIAYDNEAAVRKIDVILEGLPVISDLKLETAIDFGCGYGKPLQNFSERAGLKKAYGFDFSESAVKHAVSNYSNEQLQFQRLESLDIDENLEVMRAATEGRVDCILLIDLLEHVPDCKKLMIKLSELSDLFIIKLPIEANLLDNYSRTKEYPSTKQANGHLREFNVQTVYYFIRAIGLTPLAEGTHIYDFRDSYPPLAQKLSLRSTLIRYAIKSFRMIASRIVPKKVYIALFGPGSYYCVATFNREHILNP